MASYITRHMSTARFLLLSGFAIVCAAGLATPVSAATYYIDYGGGSDASGGTTTSTPWQRHPGMQGFAGAYSHQAGDVFIFKGGVTWPSAVYPWNISKSGSSGSQDTYTTNHTWYTGASYSQPVFDDGSSHPGTVGMLNATGMGYLTFNDLFFTKCGASQVADTDKCLVFQDTHDVFLTNNTFRTYCWISVYFVFTDGGSHSNFTFTGNDWANTSGAIWFASAAANTTMHNITYTNNTFHDFASQIGGGVHGDGALHFYVIPATDNTQYADNFTFCNNRFYGDFRNSFGGGGAMTGMFFVEAALTGIICNNDLSFSPVQANMYDGLIVLDGKNNTRSSGLQIYNNSMANIGTNAMSAALHVSNGYNNLTVKNNIASGMQYAVYVEDDTGSGATFISDNNLWNSSSGQLVFGSAFQSYAQWQASGRDAHGVLGSDPAWVAAPGDEHLRPGSPAIGAGVNLGSLNLSALTSDVSGILRLLSGAWDMGAFRYQGASNLPSPPTGLTATAH